MRFEPHLFKARRPDLVVEIPRDTPVTEAHPRRLTAWAAGKVPYTPGYDHTGHPRAASSSAEETDRVAFERAYALDRVAAVDSSSWGSYQELGDAFQCVLPQHSILDTPEEAGIAVAAFDADPAGVSDRLLEEWLHDNPKAVQAMIGGDVPEVVRRYNGSQGAGAVGYITKITKALADFDAGRLHA